MEQDKIDNVIDNVITQDLQIETLKRADEFQGFTRLSAETHAYPRDASYQPSYNIILCSTLISQNV
jgi:hypothetical protein